MNAIYFRTMVLSILILLCLAATPFAIAQNAAIEGESPIDITADSTVFLRNLPRLNFNYQNEVNLNVVNTDSPDEFATVLANVPYGSGTLEIGDKTYNLIQFHWHNSSEHLINGRGYPLEMHLVHRAADGSLTVVGVFLRRGRRNQELEKIFSQLPPEPTISVNVPDFDLTTLLPTLPKSFRYSGSLTTPPFTRGVNWVVMAQPLELSNSQLRRFRQIFPEGNSREVQPLNGRVITTDIRLFSWLD
jgi:carbonic anhydrase